MSFESGRKLGYYASLIYLILPVVAIVGGVVFVFSLIASAATGVANGTVVPAFATFFGGFIIYIIAIAIIGIVGFILFIVAMYHLSNYYSEPTIFKNILYAFLISIISTIVVYALEFAFILSSITRISQTGTPSTVFPFFALIGVIGVGLVFAIVNGLLYMRAFNKLKEKSGVDNFGTAGLLYLIGAIIPIIAWIAWIFAAMGFHKLQPPPATTSTGYYHIPPPPTNSLQIKHCPRCGTENTVNSLFCTSCGNPLQ